MENKIFNEGGEVLYDYLYKKSNVYMDRKLDKYTHIIENYSDIKEIINKKNRKYDRNKSNS
jgi:hypothetical protein